MFSASKSSAPVSGAYALTKSLRFRSSATGYLNRTPATATNRRTWTWSAWVKRGKLGAIQELFDGYWANTDNGYFWVGFTSADAFEVQLYNSTLRTTTQVFSDVSAWYHIVLAVDTTQATASNRVKVYLNGSQITAFTTNNAPTQNLDTAVNYNGAHYIGSFQGTSNLFDGYQTDVYLIDGQQLTPSSFGATDATTGQWSPAKYTGTYGTNGFHLTFANATSTTTLGYDTSGNSNNWTTNNISLTAGSTYDSMNDVPVAYSATASNYCVMNPLALGNAATITNGNLDVSYVTGSRTSTGSTFGLTSGKWYWEATITATNLATTTAMIGLTKSSSPNNTETYPGQNSTSWGYYGVDGTKYNSASGTTYGASYGLNDVIGVAFDADAGTLTFYKNGTSQGTAFSGLTSGPYYPEVGNGASVFTFTSAFNFGQRAFTYTPPTGYVALNTYNLPTPTIGATSTTLAGKFFNSVLYTGNSGVNVVSGMGFQPDMLWQKDRTSTGNNVIDDAVRGINKVLITNLTLDEITGTTYLTSFDSDGFSMNTASPAFNLTGRSYVAWGWKANGSGSTNTAGSITSTVSANTTSGFSIVTYTGTGSNATVGHGLGVTPSFIICKVRSTTGDWAVYHQAVGTNYVLGLNTTNAPINVSGYWGTPSSSTFGVLTGYGNNISGATMVAYCFAELSGYSKFGSYTGNGSSTGPFIYLGFQPKFILIKSTSASTDWPICDSTRSPYNIAQYALYADLTNSESPSNFVNFLSNGIQIISTFANLNTSGATYVYMAFASNPFKYSNSF